MHLIYADGLQHGCRQNLKGLAVEATTATVLSPVSFRYCSSTWKATAVVGVDQVVVLLPHLTDGLLSLLLGGKTGGKLVMDLCLDGIIDLIAAAGVQLQSCNPDTSSSSSPEKA